MKRILLFLLLHFFIPVFSQTQNQSIGFQENKGQIITQKGRPNKAVKYLLTSGGLNVQLRKNGFSYDIYEVKKRPAPFVQVSKKLPYDLPEKNEQTKPEYISEYKFHRVDIDFENSNSKVELIADQETKDFTNYFNITDKPEGIMQVHCYKQVTYKNIYPNIDVVFTVPADPKKTVEYNFIVHPHGKFSDIQLKFDGAETNLDNNNIQMNVCFGKMEETLPASWTEEETKKKEITVKYKKIKNNVYGFETPDLVSGKTVVIDPVPIRLWGTYYGGEGFDYATYVFTKNGFVYLSGTTLSFTNIASNGAHQNTFASPPQSSYDSFFAKFNPDGTRVWATYYGGSREDNIFKIVVSDNDNVYIAGSSISTENIATPASHQQINGSYYDGFLAKFNKDGARQWGTYYGGAGNDEIRSIIVDANENIYVSGSTFSPENISTSGSHQPNLGSLTNNDAFMAKFNKDGVRQWGTYYGGTGGDVIYDSKLDSNGSIIFLGSTYSTANISTPGSYKETSLNSDRDGFLVKFDNGGNRIWGTYFGGTQMDYFHDLGIDSSDNLYCFGQTQSTSEMSTPGVFQENYFTNNADSNGCIIKFSPNGFKIWGSYFYPEVIGGSVSKDGSVYFTGRVKSGFSSTPNAYQEFPVNNASGTDSYLVKLSTNGEMKWATYFSGEAADNAVTTALDQDNNIYLAGTTQSLTNIATAGTHQPNHFNNTQFNSGDAFLVKFQDCQSNASITSNSPVCIGKTLELKASGGTNYAWTGPNGFTSNEQNPVIVNAVGLNSGEYTCRITGNDICSNELKVTVTAGDNNPPVPSIAILPVIIGDCHTAINTIPTAADLCAGIITGTTTSPLSYALPGNYTVIWNYNDGNGNTSTQNQTVIINAPPLPALDSPQSFCSQENAALHSIAITGQNIKWYDTSTAGALLPDNTLLEDGRTYYASQSVNGCESNRIPILIKVQNTALPSGDTDQFFCSGQNPAIENIAVIGENIKWYDALTAGNALSNSTLLQNGRIYYASQTINSCESERIAVKAVIQNTPAAPAGDQNPKFCKSENPTLGSISIDGISLNWYESNTSAVPLPDNTLIQNNTTYYVSQTLGCESGRLAVLVSVDNTALPQADIQQFFCMNENAALSNIAIKGENIKWYDSPAAQTALNNTTILENRIYYATQTIDNCESSKLAVNIKILDTQPPIADEFQNFCTQDNAAISSIRIAGQNIKWYNSISDKVTLPQSKPLENGTIYYASQTVDNCESEKIPIRIQILPAGALDCLSPADELPFPKFFTPNNDGYNDTWTINPVYLAQNSLIKIFDRYGKLLKELPPNTAWDGTYIGQDQPSSDYWFVVTRFNGSEFKSHFSLKR